jgi:endonuclease/exonuclease/phosphatase family metal-dependent hydrolase
MSSNFTVCTFNMGASVDDYFQLCRYLKPDLKLASRDEDAAFKTKYQVVEKATKKCFLQHHIDVYCLQEVGSGDRPLIKSLKKKGFHLVHFEGSDIFNGLIALDANLFQEVKNHSTEIELNEFFKKDVAIATAADTVTGKRIAFVSAHVPGFNFINEDLSEEAADGDRYCKKIVKVLSKIEACTWQVVGADMNSNPEVWNKRFKTFTEHGFQTLRTQSPTNVNPRDSAHQKRELDFLFVKVEPQSSRLSLLDRKSVV